MNYPNTSVIAAIKYLAMKKPWRYTARWGERFLRTGERLATISLYDYGRLVCEESFPEKKIAFKWRIKNDSTKT